METETFAALTASGRSLGRDTGRRCRVELYRPFRVRGERSDSPYRIERRQKRRRKICVAIRGSVVNIESGDGAAGDVVICIDQQQRFMNAADLSLGELTPLRMAAG